VFHGHIRKFQRVATSHSKRLLRQSVRDFNWMEDALALSEDLVDLLELKVAGLGEEEVDNCRSRSDDDSRQRCAKGMFLRGKMRRKFVQAYTTKYRHPMVEKAIGVISATRKLSRQSVPCMHP